MASKMTYNTVRSRMATVRDRFLRDPYGATPKQIRMAEDPGVFSFLCRFYWFMYKAGNGNAESIQRTDYKDLLWTISDRESRAYMLEQLSYDGSASAGKMASDLKALGKKYGGRRLTYHVVCPISKKRYDFESKDDLRWFTVKILGHIKGTKTQRIRLYDGKIYIGSMWRSAGIIYYQSKGVRAKRIVNDRDGTIRR